MNLFDIVGPVMVGPSSSHTAGAVKIGYVARKLLQEPIAQAEILLYGSFLATGKGHGTPKALVAGLMGMQPDDSRIPSSIELAQQQGVQLSFGAAELRDGHPNSVMLRLTGESGKTLEVVGQSIGGFSPADSAEWLLVFSDDGEGNLDLSQAEEFYRATTVTEVPAYIEDANRCYQEAIAPGSYEGPYDGLTVASDQ